MKAVPRRDGPLVVLRTFGTLAERGADALRELRRAMKRAANRPKVHAPSG